MVTCQHCQNMCNMMQRCQHVSRMSVLMFPHVSTYACSHMRMHAQPWTSLNTWRNNAKHCIWQKVNLITVYAVRYKPAHVWAYVCAKNCQCIWYLKMYARVIGKCVRAYALFCVSRNSGVHASYWSTCQMKCQYMRQTCSCYRWGQGSANSSQWGSATKQSNSVWCLCAFAFASQPTSHAQPFQPHFLHAVYTAAVSACSSPEETLHAYTYWYPACLELLLVLENRSCALHLPESLCLDEVWVGEFPEKIAKTGIGLSYIKTLN